MEPPNDGSSIRRNIRKFKFGFAAASVALCFASCADYIPKPEGYMRFDLPEKEYVSFDSPCAYGFEIPTYCEMRPKAENDCWYDMVFPRYAATLYLSYLPVEANLDELLEDSHVFVYKHSVKADAILEQTIDNGAGTGGMLVEIGGNSATPLQFFVTDSTRHFLRGSLYFGSTPNRDSLNPLIEFFKKDIEHLMETTTFKLQTTKHQLKTSKKTETR